MEENKETGKAERAHSLLGASSSHRWLHCTPSAMAEASYPDASSEFALEGTLAHALCARTLKQSLGMDTSGEEAEIAGLYDRWHTGGMDEHVEGYAAYVSDRYRQARERAARRGGMMPEISIERRLDYSLWVEGGFGTGDAVIVSDGEVEVIDFKYGKGVEVRAERNTQMMLYALGAIDLFDYAYGVETVAMTIYQPRIGNLSTWSMRAADLRRWAEEELAPLARLAATGRGVRSSGPWCRFCKAKGDCPRLAAESLELWQLHEDSGAISAEDLPRVLERLGAVSDWVKAVEERALARALAGESIEGWKVVEGRSVRKISDPERAAAILREHGAGDSEIFKPRELRTITDLEKAWGKKAFGAMMGDVIQKPRGKPALVPDSDRRKAMSAADDFKGINL